MRRPKRTFAEKALSHLTLPSDPREIIGRKFVFSTSTHSCVAGTISAFHIRRIIRKKIPGSKRQLLECTLFVTTPYLFPKRRVWTAVGQAEIWSVLVRESLYKDEPPGEYLVTEPDGWIQGKLTLL